MDWLLRENLDPATLPESVNEAGVSRILLHPFDLPDSAAAPPLSIAFDENGRPQVRLGFPEAGLRRAVRLESVLNDGEENSALTNFEKGASGEQFFLLPERGKQFVRVVVE